MARPQVFIGSGELSRLERKVLTHSLRRNTAREVDIWVLNGTHNSIERNDEQPFPAPMSLALKYRNYTEFSLYRYLIPELCNYHGRAIYLDSDMICLSDIGELFDTPMNAADFLATRHYDEQEWGTSVMLIDCERCRFDLNRIYDEIDSGHYTYPDFSRMSPRFLEHHPYKIGPLDPNWNVFDRYDRNTKLIHYTNLLTQPWRRTGHPYGRLWFQYLDEAVEAGIVTEEDFHLGIMRGAARPSVRDGNSATGILIRRGRRFSKAVARRLKLLFS